MNRPLPVTAESDPVIDATVSADGRQAVYVTHRGRFQGPVDTVHRPAPISPCPSGSPTTRPRPPTRRFPQDGRYVAYTGTGHDVKGDIYLVEPVRRSGETAPADRPGNRRRGAVLFPGRPDHLLSSEGIGPAAIPAGGTGAGHRNGSTEAAGHRRGRPVSGRVSGRHPDRFCHHAGSTPNGDIFVLDLATGRVRPITAGPPCGHGSGMVSGREHPLLFPDRRGYGTPAAGSRAEGRAAVFRIDSRAPSARPFPVTPPGS